MFGRKCDRLKCEFSFRIKRCSGLPDSLFNGASLYLEWKGKSLESGATKIGRKQGNQCVFEELIKFQTALKQYEDSQLQRKRLTWTLFEAPAPNKKKASKIAHCELDLAQLASPHAVSGGAVERELLMTLHGKHKCAEEVKLVLTAFLRVLKVNNKSIVFSPSSLPGGTAGGAAVGAGPGAVPPATKQVSVLGVAMHAQTVDEVTEDANTSDSDSDDAEQDQTSVATDATGVPRLALSDGNVSPRSSDTTSLGGALASSPSSGSTMSAPRALSGRRAQLPESAVVEQLASEVEHFKALLHEEQQKVARLQRAPAPVGDTTAELAVARVELAELRELRRTHEARIDSLSSALAQRHPSPEVIVKGIANGVPQPALVDTLLASAQPLAVAMGALLVLIILMKMF